MMSSSMDRKPPWVELPREITALILHKLGAFEILTVAQHVCTTWRSVCQDPSMWRIIDMASTLYLLNGPYDLDKMCRHAVDRSQGQLVDISIEMFTGGDSLIYISERCPRLQRLQLAYCYDLNEASLSTAFQNLPLLEELHLYCSPINPNVIEMIGISCPLLKSFKLNKSWNTGLHGHPWSLALDLEAEGIAQRMPQLRHLELIANQMSNKGLQAIIDGCPHLETLDLRECYNISFCGDVAKECSRRFKNLRRPLDALDDCLFSSGLGLRYPTSDDDYITGFSDMDLVSDYEDYLEFSGGSSMGSYIDPDDDVEIYDDDEPFFD